MMSAPSDPRERKWPVSLGGSWAEVQGVKIWDKERITSNHEATRPLPCGATRSQREISECRMGSVVHGRLRGRLCPPSPKPQALHHRTVSRLQATFLSNLKGNLLGKEADWEFHSPPTSLWLFCSHICSISSSFIQVIPSTFPSCSKSTLNSNVYF